MTIEAVTFDFWDTLCHAGTPDVSRGRRADRLEPLLASFAAHGGWPSIAGVDLVAALRAINDAHTEHWHGNRQFGTPDATRHFVDALGVECDDVQFAAIERAIAGHDESERPPLTPNIAEALAQLRHDGIRIGIICDVGLAPSVLLREHLEHHGVLAYFDHWSFSDEVGHYKPAQEIFDHAFEGLGVTDRSRVAHIGDLRRTDVAGARAAGAIAIRYTGVTDDPAGHETEPIEGDHVVGDHAELVALLRTV